jgi:hypothetical protein
MKAVRAVAGINVLIILENPYGCRWSRRFHGNETLKKPIKKFSVASFSFSSSTASRLLLFAHRGKIFEPKACAATGLNGAREWSQRVRAPS